MNMLYRSLARAALLLIAVVAVTYSFVGFMWTESVDLAHHYALVVRLMEYGNAAFPLDLSLGEMNVYPRLSHQMAVVAGRWLASPLAGLQTLAVLSLVLLWAGLAWLINTLPPRMAAIASLVVAGLLAANRYWLPIPLHGDELIGNFFYPQLLGQMLCVALIGVNLTLEKRAAPLWLRYGLMVPATYLLVGIHLLPALALLTMMGLMIAAELLLMWRRRQPGLAVAGATGAGALLAALGAVVLHPGFAVMRSISKQNGYIPLRYLDSTPALMWYGAAVALASALLVWYWARRPRAASRLALKYLGLYGLAIGGLCLAQGLAWVFDFGSEYAMRKYVFALDTVALVELALLPALLLARQTAPRERWYAVLQACVLPAALTAAVCVQMLSAPPVRPLQQLVALERSVKILQERIGRPAHGKYDYVIGLDGGTPMVEYMLSIAELRLKRLDNPNAASLLFRRDIDNWAEVGRVVTAEHGGYDRYPACRVGAPVDGLVALDGACMLRSVSTSARIDMGDGNKMLLCSVQGLSGREANGSWTAEREATLRCPVPQVDGKAPRRVDVEVIAFRGDVAAMRAVVGVDGQPRQHVTVAGTGFQTLSLPLGETVSGEVVIRLEIPDALSPLQLGLGNDGRKLGLFVHALEFKD